MTDHAKKPKDPAGPDQAVAVSVAQLRALVDAAGKHVGKDPELAAAVAPFTDL